MLFFEVNLFNTLIEGGGAAVIPPGLLVWLKAAEGVTTDSAVPMTQSKWMSADGTAFTVENSTKSTQPLYNADVPLGTTGASTSDFSGTNRKLESLVATPQLTNSDYSIVILARRTSGAGEVLLSHNANGTTTGSALHLLLDGDTLRHNVWGNDATTFIFSKDIGEWTNFGVTSAVESSASTYVNGTQVYSYPSKTLTTNQTLRIGAAPWGSGSSTLRVSDVLIWNRALSQTEMTNAHKALFVLRGLDNVLVDKKYNAFTTKAGETLGYAK